MDIRPDRVDQVLLAEHAAGIGHEQLEHVEGFRPEPDRFATGSSQPGAFRVELKYSETEHLGLRNPLSLCARDANIREISESHRRPIRTRSLHRGMILERFAAFAAI